MVPQGGFEDVWHRLIQVCRLGHPRHDTTPAIIRFSKSGEALYVVIEGGAGDNPEDNMRGEDFLRDLSSILKKSGFQHRFIVGENHLPTRILLPIQLPPANQPIEEP